MADGVLGLGSGQAASLNQELIDKLKTAERASTVAPLETSLEDWDTEKETLTSIIDKAKELLESIKPFDLFITDGDSNAFEQKSATSSGSSVVFDADDVSSLNTGVTEVEVTQLSQKYVFQTETLTSADSVLTTEAGATINIEHNNIIYTFDATNKTAEELADEIDSNENINASVEDVGSGNFRLVIKSAESGLDNGLDVQMSETGTDLFDLGFGDAGNTVQSAKDMIAKVDGVIYNVADNILTVDALKITAVELGTSTININKDTSAITTGLEEFAIKYNELVSLIDAELYSADSKIEDKSTLRSVMTAIKDNLFGNYGENSDLNIFNYGFGLDSSGYLSVDNTKITDAIENDYENFKKLLVGTAENEGLGTQLKTLVDSLDGFDGMLTAYENSMDTRQTSLEEQKEKAIESLDSKYDQLAAQFAAYGTIINQFEASFDSLKLFIAESSSS